MTGQADGQRQGGHWVVLSSANGSTNLGDEAMWEATVLVLRELVGPVRIVTDGHASFRPGVPDIEVLPYLHLQLRRGARLPHGLLERLVSYPRRNAYAASRARALAAGIGLPAGAELWRARVATSRGLVISGAGAMTDDFAPHGVSSWWLAASWARAAGVPTYLLGQGIGPIVDDSLRAQAADLVGWSRVVNVRETTSDGVVRGLRPGLSTEVTPDWAILDEPADADRARAREYLDAVCGGAPFIALSAHRRHNTSKAQLERLSGLLEGTTRHALASGRRVLFVPNMIGSGYSDDRATFDLVARSWPAQLRSSVHVVRAPLGPRVTRAVLGGADFLATTRYHPLVFALAEGTPTVGVSYDAYYDQKLVGASQMFGVNGNVLRLEEASAERLFGMAAELSPPTPPPSDANRELLRRALVADRLD